MSARRSPTGSTLDPATNSASSISARSPPTRSPIRTGSSMGDASATGLKTRWSWTPSCLAPPAARSDGPFTAARRCATCSDGCPHDSGLSARKRRATLTKGLSPSRTRMAPGLSLTEHFARSPRHCSFYLACGEERATPIIFVHGWPELSISWRGQLPVFAGLGFRAIAPDMRGYGRSSVPRRREDYALEPIVGDMIELLDSIGARKAIWVGHDWGAPVVWSIAQHHAERCHGVANLCVP